MKCKHEPCNNDAKGNGKYCSATCKTLFNRNKSSRNNAGVTASKSLSVTQADTQPASLDDYHDLDGRKYATRTNPDKLNWGKRMNMNELNQAGLKGNRVTIPGDWDYVKATP